MITNQLISKIAFIFLVLAVIAGGESITLLSCQFQYQLKNSLFLKHFISFILIFGLIMMEGGWEFNNIDINNKNSNNTSFNWSNGNTIHSLGWALILYTFFLIISKMKFIFSILTLLVLLFIYILNTYKNHLTTKKELTKEIDKFLNILLNLLTIILVILIIIGFYNYLIYQKNEYKKDFNYFKFLFGTNKCKSL